MVSSDKTSYRCASGVFRFRNFSVQIHNEAQESMSSEYKNFFALLRTTNLWLWLIKSTVLWCPDVISRKAPGSPAADLIHAESNYRISSTLRAVLNPESLRRGGILKLRGAIFSLPLFGVICLFLLLYSAEGAFDFAGGAMHPRAPPWIQHCLYMFISEVFDPAQCLANIH